MATGSWVCDARAGYGHGVELAVYREENPGTGRWDSQDPLGFEAGQDNFYGYVADDPSNLLDPSGLDKTDYILVFGTLWGAAWDAWSTWRREAGRGVEADAQLAELQQMQRDSGRGGTVESQELGGFGPNGQGGELNSGSMSRYFGGSTANARRSAQDMLTLGATVTAEELAKQLAFAGSGFRRPKATPLRSARKIWLSRTGALASARSSRIHHRIPLEWAHGFRERIRTA